jgi:hypothetical protein
MWIYDIHKLTGYETMTSLANFIHSFLIFGISLNLQDSISSSIDGWADSHPFMGWFLHHPGWAFALAIVCLFLFWGLLNATTRVTEKFWLLLLQLPIKLSQWILKISPGFIKKVVSMGAPKPDPNQQLKEAVDRLEELKTEQEALIKQIKAILAAEKK